MISDTFCILPWIHFYANPDGGVLPCCIGDHNLPLGNVQQYPVEQIWNNSRYRSIRLNMLSGKRCDECAACYRSEDAGSNSFRNSVNRDFAEYIPIVDKTNSDGSLDKLELKYLDIRWSNICNFKCRSCSSTYSSSWATEDNKFGDNKKVFIFSGGEDNDFLYEQLKPYFAEVKEIYFAGGEPLLMDKHYEILKHLIDHGNTELKIRYNSNLSSLEYKKTSVIDYWKHFSNIKLNVSLDSWGDRAEYIREGTDWSVIENNIKTVKEKCPNIHLGISTVVSVFNVWTIMEFVDYLIDRGILLEHTEISFYSILNPEYYSFRILDQDLKFKIIEKISKRTYNKNIQSQLNNIVGHLNSSTYQNDLKLEFKKQTDYYDKIRNRDFRETFPELREFYENIF